MTPPLILASTSPYRRALLERLGLPFTCRKPPLDEEAEKSRFLATATVADRPLALAEHLAVAKARSVAILHPGAVVIGGDQLAAADDGAILGKPGTVAAAVSQLAGLAGREHRLITAIAVCHPGGLERHTDIARLRMRALESAAIARYVAADQPLDCAGAYKLECRGIALFERIDAADHSAITGLPLIALTTILARLGLAVP